LPCSALAAYQDGETYASDPVMMIRHGAPGRICCHCGFALAIWAITRSSIHMTGSNVASGNPSRSTVTSHPVRAAVTMARNWLSSWTALNGGVYTLPT
jgi:hypothetical protein